MGAHRQVEVTVTMTASMPDGTHLAATIPASGPVDPRGLALNAILAAARTLEDAIRAWSPDAPTGSHAANPPPPMSLFTPPPRGPGGSYQPAEVDNSATVVYRQA